MNEKPLTVQNPIYLLLHSVGTVLNQVLGIGYISDWKDVIRIDDIKALRNKSFCGSRGEEFLVTNPSPSNSVFHVLFIFGCPIASFVQDHSGILQLLKQKILHVAFLELYTRLEIRLLFLAALRKQKKIELFHFSPGI
ncbi:hypothetical protein CDAR_583461 [Caerostris darwini]|uniref:Uncharacterized protein n=1 Tax=Caerostris darwini TaxID=1538125 RepID=A0AAV4PYW8_9ARAC|nr:hypothetical protein CDAR_583461 [Caerostris darwini]